MKSSAAPCCRKSSSAAGSDEESRGSVRGELKEESHQQSARRSDRSRGVTDCDFGRGARSRKSKVLRDTRRMHLGHSDSQIVACHVRLGRERPSAPRMPRRRQRQPPRRIPPPPLAAPSNALHAETLDGQCQTSLQTRPRLQRPLAGPAVARRRVSRLRELPNSASR